MEETEDSVVSVDTDDETFVPEIDKEAPISGTCEEVLNSAERYATERIVHICRRLKLDEQLTLDILTTNLRLAKNKNQ